MVMPGFDKVENERRAVRAFDRLTVEAHTGPRILWGQADGHDSLKPVVLYLLDDLRNQRLPIAHRDVHGQADLGSEQLALASGDFVHRRVTNEGVTVPHLFYDLGRDRATSSHVAKKLGNVIERIGCAVSEEEHGGLVGFPISHSFSLLYLYGEGKTPSRQSAARRPYFSCTNLQSCFTVSTGVSGRIP